MLSIVMFSLTFTILLCPNAYKYNQGDILLFLQNSNNSKKFKQIRKIKRSYIYAVIFVVLSVIFLIDKLIFITILLLSLIIFTKIFFGNKYKNKRIERKNISNFLNEVNLFLQSGMSILAAIEATYTKRSDELPEKILVYVNCKKFTIPYKNLNKADLWEEVFAVWEYGIDNGVSLLKINNYLIEMYDYEDSYLGDLVTGQSGSIATANTLMALPLVGIFLGQLMGSNSLTILITSNVGKVLLVIGLGFILVGSYWIEKIIHGVSVG